ncbi:alpha/beta hydrolase [Streptomyces sp. AB3(2024)]|uniref:alpha/beta hydrolase n=1 Tax=Streptomyces sp. AB3(2024) TaxID=3317321 RepID=UPI0035A2F3D7
MHPSTTHLIVLPGGGYAVHAPHEAEPIVAWLSALGLSASVFRYPLQARHPEPLLALRAEIRRRREQGADRIGLIGFSAGGHLAGMAALAPFDDPRESVQFAVLCYAILRHTAEDLYVPPEHTYRPASALAAHEVPHTAHVFAHGPHSLGLAEGSSGDAATWTELAASWIAEQVRGASVGGGLG